ncbi:MAG: hypothetical protein KDB90_17455 [Planctomycetes bacterium]|nr:hypothetical protein [Planctomycetota bacterium]
MKRVLGIGIPAVIAGLAVALTLVLAQPAPPTDEPYNFNLGKDITAEAADVVINPRFKAVANDRFAYECYYNATRTGVVSDGAEVVETFHNKEAWTTAFSLACTEDPLDGRKDLLVHVGIDMIEFSIDNGDARYTGYIGQQTDMRKPGFKEILPDGKRNDVTNIPGWAGINSGALEANRGTQATTYGGSACFNINDAGRIYNETYYADWGNSDQTNYPGRLIEPLQLALAVHPEFKDAAALKLGETLVVRRRLPVSAARGSTIDYDVTYKLEKLYGTVAEPTAARLTFDAVPVQREHSQEVDGLVTKFTAPDIKGGKLLLDLVKGVAAWVSWEYRLSGTVTQPGTALSTAFDVKFDLTASLREQKKPE